jgi:hypothetical protein
VAVDDEYREVDLWDQRLTMAELAAGGWFEPVRTGHWHWPIELTDPRPGHHTPVRA